MNTTIQIRTKTDLKKEMQRIFKKLGLDLSSGTNLYYRQVYLEKGIPFRPRTENGFTPEYEAMILKESAWAKKHAKRYATPEAMFKDLYK